MDFLKTIFKFILIVALVLVFAFAIMFGILFFFPKTQIFGFRYVANHEENSIIIADASVTKINLETNNYDVIVKPNSVKDVSNNPNLSIVIKNDYTGFANKNNTGALVKNITNNEYIDINEFKSPNLTYFKSGGEYTISIKEPTGMVSYGSSKIIVNVPEKASGVEYNIVTNKGIISFSKNDINTTKVISSGDVNVAVNSSFGSFNLDNLNMNADSTLNIKNFLGRVNINSEKIANVKINSNSGNFTFKNIGYEGVNGKLTVSGNNPYITVNKIYGGVDFKTTTGLISCDELVGDGIIETDNGIVRINKIYGGLSLKSSSGEVTIKQIGENASSKKPVSIETKSSSVTLGTDTTPVYYLTSITGTTSKVKVTNLHDSDASINTTKGSIKVDFVKDSKQKNITVSSSSGAIELTNVYGNVNAQSTSGKIKTSFNYISTLGEFNTDKGNVEIVLPAPTNDTNKQYTLNLNNKSNKVNVKIGEFSYTKFDGEKNADGYYNFTKTFPMDKTTTNTISVKTNSGKINIHE